MKLRLLLSTLLAFLALGSAAQTVLFSDDFESGLSNWVISGGPWGLTTTQSHSPTHSLTDSPGGLYANNVTSYCTMTSGVNLSNALDADLTFWALYDIESGFDYMYIDVSTNLGSSWTNIVAIDGNAPWTQLTYNLGGFVGNSDVRIRFRFETDQGFTLDGMYIDDLSIISYTTDNSPPLVLHTPSEHYEGTLNADTMSVDLVDISNISLAEMKYKVDNGTVQTLNAIDTTNDTYRFVLPQQLPGSWVDYWVTATDSAPAFNSITTDTFRYITGNYIKYEAGVVDFVDSYGPLSPSQNPGCAVRFTLNGSADLVTALIRNYTDINNPNDSIEVHVWDAGTGGPGMDIITPFKVFPEANLMFPNQMTRIDLRPLASQLSGLTGDFYIGFLVPQGEAWVTQTTPGTAGRTFFYNGTSWTLDTDDYHFRAITSEVIQPPTSLFSFDTVNDPTIAFTDLSTGNPSSWSWDFDDNGATSTMQNPNHTFSAPGTYNVCLTVTNSAFTASSCQNVTINNGAPVANFSVNVVNDPLINFTDLSLYAPTSWAWDFGDGSPVDNNQNPTHIYASSGVYNVCLTVTNAHGTDNHCILINVFNDPLVADFTFDDTNDPTVDFTDASLNNPSSWLWDFDDNGATSTMANPSHTFSSNASYNVCLTVTNPAGSDSICKTVTIDGIVPVADFSFDATNDPLVVFTDLSTHSPTQWDWDYDDGATNNQQNPVHLYTGNGTYNVCLIASNQAGASAPTCKQVIIVTVGDEELSTEVQTQIFPNPATTEAYILLKPAPDPNHLQFQLRDLQGRVIPVEFNASQGLIRLERANLPSGTYLFELTREKKVIARGKLIFQ